MRCCFASINVVQNSDRPSNRWDKTANDSMMEFIRPGPIFSMIFSHILDHRISGLKPLLQGYIFLLRAVHVFRKADTTIGANLESFPRIRIRSINAPNQSCIGHILVGRYTLKNALGEHCMYGVRTRMSIPYCEGNSDRNARVQSNFILIRRTNDVMNVIAWRCIRTTMIAFNDNPYPVLSKNIGCNHTVNRDGRPPPRCTRRQLAVNRVAADEKHGKVDRI
jgi:hypothetical protein